MVAQVHPETKWRWAAGASLAVLPVVSGACGSNSGASAIPGVISAVGAENEYANVLSQIGGNYVHVSSILDNPNTDPHDFESSPSVAQEVAGAELVVQNGVGYDDFMNKIEAASPSSTRKVIVVQRLLGLPLNTANPHLWYDPKTMPVVARAISSELSSIEPSHASYFRQNLSIFDRSLEPLFGAIASFKARYRGVGVATSEPVADYLLAAIGADNLTPYRFQADVMNGVDPAPQDISVVNAFFSDHKVKVFCYNEQVVNTLTLSLRQNAERAGIPTVGVYETMPTPGYDYQSWMLTEVLDLREAIATGSSSGHL